MTKKDSLKESIKGFSLLKTKTKAIENYSRFQNLIKTSKKLLNQLVENKANKEDIEKVKNNLHENEQKAEDAFYLLNVAISQVENNINKINNEDYKGDPRNEEFINQARKENEQLTVKEKYQKIINSLDAMVNVLSEKINELEIWLKDINQTIKNAQEEKNEVSEKKTTKTETKKVEIEDDEKPSPMPICN